MNNKFKIKDRVYYQGKFCEVVCMDQLHYGLMVVDDAYRASGGATNVSMIRKTEDIQEIAIVKFGRGQLVQSTLKGEDSLIGTVVGHEAGNKVIVKSHKGPERARYTYRPDELEYYTPPKQTYVTFVVNDQMVTQTPGGQMMLNIEGCRTAEYYAHFGKLMGLTLVKMEEK